MARRTKAPWMQTKARYDAQRQYAAPKYGVFKWRGDGVYKAADAVKIYTREHDAQRLADKLGDNHVVRSIDLS